MNPLKDIIFYDQKDKLCINLMHDVKVYLKMNDSIMIKDFTNNNCIAVSGHVRYYDKTRMFSLHRDGVRVHHNSSDSLDIEIIDHNTNEYNNTFTARLKIYEGVISTDTELSNSRHQMFDSLFNKHIKSCEEVFNGKQKEISQEMKKKALMLIDSCSLIQTHDGDFKLKLVNGLEINQLSSGHTLITFSKLNVKIDMNSKGSANLSLGRSTIVSANNLFHAKKGSKSTGISNVTKIDGVLKFFSDVFKYPNLYIFDFVKHMNADGICNIL